MKQFIYRIFCGFFLGLSVFAPGFSGSVIAITLGVYQDLVRIASNPFKQLKKNILFLLPLGIGAGLSGLLFLIAFRFLFERYEKAVYLLFIGLMAGNLPVIVKEIRKCGFKKHYVLGAIGACAAALALGFFTAGAESVTGAQGVTAGYPLLILGGLMSGTLTFLPGMSVSAILISLGLYGQILFAAESLLRFDFIYLIPMAVFCVADLVGVMLASRGIKIVYERYPGFANTTVLGFMSGALVGIFVRALRLPNVSFSWPLGIGMLAVGAAISVLFVFMARKLDKAEPNAA